MSVERRETGKKAREQVAYEDVMHMKRLVRIALFIWNENNDAFNFYFLTKHGAKSIIRPAANMPFKIHSTLKPTNSIFSKPVRKFECPSSIRCTGGQVTEFAAKMKGIFNTRDLHP